MPEPIPSVPPSIEHLTSEMLAWTTTPVGRRVVASKVPAALAESMARHCPDVVAAALGKVLLRLASHLAGTMAEVPDTPPWMLANLVGVAGLELIAEVDPDA